jgi:TetR/AcrR family transcriptional repressor of nem operon
MALTRKAIATRRRIVDCAADLISKQGFSRTRLEEVLQGSRVQKGNFYYYFRSKDDLGLAVMNEQLQGEARVWLQGLMADSGDPWADLLQLPERLAHAASEDKSILNVINQLAQDLSRAGQEYREQVSAMLRGLAGVLVDKFRQLEQAGRLEKQADPQELGEYVASLLDGALYWDGLTDGGAQLKRSMELGLEGLACLVKPAGG